MTDTPTIEVRRFNYQFVKAPGDPYSEHDGRLVEVIGEAGPDQSDHHIDPDLEKLYVICDPLDGWRGFAFESEIYD